MAAPLDIQANQGTADQLPQGAATELNDAMPADLAPPELAAPESGSTETPAAADTSEPEPAQASDYEPIYTPEGDDDSFIVGPTTRPNEDVTAGAYASLKPSMSPELAAAVPVFLEAADLPDAPEQLKALVAYLTQAAES